MPHMLPTDCYHPEPPQALQIGGLHPLPSGNLVRFNLKNVKVFGYHHPD